MTTSRLFRKRRRLGFQDEEGGGIIYITFTNPTAKVYLQIQRSLLAIEGLDQVKFQDDLKMIADLSPLTLGTIIEVEGANADLERGGSFEINSKMDLAGFNKAAETEFGTWQQVFNEAFPEYIARLARLFLEEVRENNAVPKIIEKNSEGMSGDSSPAIPNRAN
jgi:hypothetical protein